jgi:hypothetical protein
MIVTTCPAPPALAVEGSVGPTTRAFVVGFAQVLLVPVTGLAALLGGWTMAHGTGWPAATAAVAGWSGAVVLWLRHRGWPAATAHLLGWAAPAALLALLAGAGSLSADGLVVWGPVGAVFAVALVSAYSPHRVSLRSRGRRAR